MYDFLIVGSGLFGATYAHQMTKAGLRCLVVDRRDHTGGNVYCEDIEDITVHKYGAHIFRTNDVSLWNFVNELTPFFHYTHQVVANYRGKTYSLPFNMNTFNQVWGVTDPKQAIAKIQSQSNHIKRPRNLEEKAIQLVGTDLYEMFFRGYTEKQWGRNPTELPASIIRRILLRFTYDNNYYNDTYQGIPFGGYNNLTNALLKGIDVRTGLDFLQNRNISELAKHVVFTGAIDEYYDFMFGQLEYRSLEFQHKTFDFDNYQGCSVMNYTDNTDRFTRSIEHRHFDRNCRSKSTVVTWEYPIEWKQGIEPYYPINDEKNQKRYIQYRDHAAATDPNVTFGGRLGTYRYLDMEQVIASALKAAKTKLADHHGIFS